MALADVHDLVSGTGRLSAALFVVALIGAGAGYRPVRLLAVFAIAHGVHFMMVAWLAAISDGANLRDIGGWPTAISVGAGFYGLIALAAAAWSGAGHRIVRGLGHAAVVLIALAFLATYVPLAAASPRFAVPVAVITGALGFYLMRAIHGQPERPP